MPFIIIGSSSSSSSSSKEIIKIIHITLLTHINIFF